MTSWGAPTRGSAPEPPVEGDRGTSDRLAARVPVARFAKAVVDRVAAAFLLLATAPLLLALWAAVRLDSPGPGFHVQTRTGRDGEPFRMVKLRTMHQDAESLLLTLARELESDSEPFQIRRDPRVTRSGYWLRRLSLDELPRLFNVLRGEMPLIGSVVPAAPHEPGIYRPASL